MASYSMTNPMIIRVIILLIFASSFCSQGAIITVPPVSVTVPPLTTATFTCEGTGDILNWIVHSAELTESIKQQRQISVNTTVNNTNFSSVLTVNAIPINDDLGIACEVITINPFDRVISSHALTIGGVSSVEDLHHNFTSNNSLLITWSPPVYFSDDVPVGSPFSYQVLVTDKEDGEILLNTNTLDTNIEVPNVTECDTFNISVTALVGQYNISSFNNPINNYRSYSITEYDTQPLIPSVSFKLGCPPSRCLVSLMDGSTEVTDIITETEHIIEFKLSPFRHYELTAVVKNLRGKTRATCYTSISTFHTENISISSPYTNGSVSVQCVFVSGSTADGCHVIFIDTSNGRNEHFNITGLTLLSLPAGNYTVTAYDIINGAFYGPAVYYPIPFEIIKIMPPTSFSSTYKSMFSTASSEVILTPTNSTTIPILGTETTSSTSGTTNNTNSVIPVVAGILGGIVLVVMIILAAVCIGITVNKRKKNIIELFLHSDIVQQPQAETNPYQDVQELRNEVPITRLPVLLLSNRSIDEDNPYGVTMSEFLPDNHDTIPSHAMDQLMSQGQRPSLTSTTTQDTTLDDSISSKTSNNIHDNESTTDPTNATDTINVTFNDTDTATADNEATNNTAATVTDTAATVDPTYAFIAKRTGATVIPAVDQRVEYNTVTGDINKRGGGVTVYPPDDISANPPPPSYANTIAQERATTVSSLQFKAPVTGDAPVVHGKYGKYPPTNTEDDYDVNTPVQAETSTTDENEIIVQPSAASVPSNYNDVRKVLMTDESPVAVNQLSPVHFQWLVSIEESLDFLHADDEYIADEMFEVTKSDNFEEKEETGAFVSGITLKAELHLLVKRKMNKFRSHNIFEVDENHEVVVAVPNLHMKPI